MAAPQSAGDHVCKMLTETEVILEALARVYNSTLGRSALDHIGFADIRREDELNKSNQTSFHQHQNVNVYEHCVFNY